MKALLMACLIVSSSAQATPLRTHSSAVYLQTLSPKGQSSCSGTAVKSNVILTAKHCIPEGILVLGANGLAVTVTKYIVDKSDHVLIVTNDHQFKHIAYVDFSNSMHQTQNLYVWGNPGDFTDQFRRGYVTGKDNSSDHPASWLIDFNGFFGDSGSCLFNSKDVCIGITSISSFSQMTNPGPSMKFMGSYDFSFTPEQLKEAGL